MKLPNTNKSMFTHFIKACALLLSSIQQQKGGKVERAHCSIKSKRNKKKIIGQRLLPSAQRRCHQIVQGICYKWATALLSILSTWLQQHSTGTSHFWNLAAGSWSLLSGCCSTYVRKFRAIQVLRYDTSLKEQQHPCHYCFLCMQSLLLISFVAGENRDDLTGTPSTKGGRGVYQCSQFTLVEGTKGSISFCYQGYSRGNQQEYEVAHVGLQLHGLNVEGIILQCKHILSS